MAGNPALTNSSSELNAQSIRDAARLNTGSIPDARVPVSAVTQHQTALSITESQISDLQAYLLNITSEVFSDLSDVTITAIASGELIKWDGAKWINNTLSEAGIAATSHSHSVDSLSDVTVTSIATGEILKWDGTKWINNTLAEAGIAAASHTHAATDIASGTLVHERGGLEADVSAYNGLVKISGGATSQAVESTDYAKAAVETGAISIASQAALDFIYASSATQFGRLAKGTALQFPRINAAGTGWEFATEAVAAASPVTAYTVTQANAINTTSETDIISFTVLGGTWVDGEYIVAEGWFSIKNNAGVAATFTPKLYTDGTSYTMDNNSQSDSATEQHVPWRLHLQRVGSEIWAVNKTGGDSSIAARGVSGFGFPGITYGVWSGWAAGTFRAIVNAAPNFATDTIIKISVTPSVADLTTFVKVWSGIAHRFGV